MAVSRRGNCLLVGGGDGAVRKRISAAASRRSRSGPTQSIGQSVSPSTYQRTNFTNEDADDYDNHDDHYDHYSYDNDDHEDMTAMMAMAMAKWKGEKMK